MEIDKTTKMLVVYAVRIVLLFALCTACVWIVVEWVFGMLFLTFESPADYPSEAVLRSAQYLKITIEILVIGILGTIAYICYARKSVRVYKEIASRVKTATPVFAPEQLNALYENSPVPYFMMDDDGAVRNPNKATIRFFSAKSEDFQVANMYHLIARVHNADASHGVPLLVSKIQRGVVISDEEVTFNTYDGKERIALISVHSLESTTSLPFRHLITLRDITMERHTEEVKTDFLLLASHQLRTPTTTIKWYIDYLVESKSVQMDATVREYLGEIYSANERMMELISTLLTVARIEMGTLAPEYSDITVGQVMDDVLAELASNITQKQISVTKNVTNEGSIHTDRTMVRIVLHNLLTNAIKYTPQGGAVTVNITYDHNGCTTVVKDTGCGIPIAEQSRIFSKLFRATNAKKVTAHGTGLGLYLTKSFVESLGGSVSYESLEGRGSIFSIWLPRFAPGV